MSYGSASTVSPVLIVPPESMSARSPPLCTRPRNTPVRVSRSRCEHGSHLRWP